MSDLLGIGTSGVLSYQRTLATVANNIANVNTEGYTRQETSVSSNQPRRLGSGYVGNGVFFGGVERQFNAYIDANLRNSASELRGQEALSGYVNRLMDVMADKNLGMSGAFNRFFESAREWAADPASRVARTIFLRDTDALATRFRELAAQFEAIDKETQSSLETDAGQVNALTEGLAQVNLMLRRHATEDRQPLELLDHRDQLLRDLAAYLPISADFTTNGEARVWVAGADPERGGILLVEGENTRPLSVVPSANNPEQLTLVAGAYRRDAQTLTSLNTGRLGGVLEFRDQVLAVARDALDQLATQFADSLNTVHHQGVDMDGQEGQDLLSIDAGVSRAAEGIRLILQDVTKLAAAAPYRVLADPANLGSADATVSYQTPSTGDDVLPSLLAGEQYELVFTSSTTYQIWRNSDNQSMDTGSFDPYDPTAQIDFQGLTVQFSLAPRSGDRFTLDGNADGIGDNRALLDLIALEHQSTMSGGLTFNEDYIASVNRVGNVVSQAGISVQALTVVYEQAREARDEISAVNLDEEAAALVRYQQAYQANAKVLQAATELFDTILQVR